MDDSHRLAPPPNLDDTISRGQSLSLPFASPMPPAQRFQLHTGDAVDWLRTLGSDSVNLVITDPAYESLEKHRAIGTTTRLKHSKASSNDWFQIFPNQRFPELFAEVYRVLQKNSHFYLFCDQETMFVAKTPRGSCGVPVLETTHLGQAANWNGVPLPLAL